MPLKIFTHGTQRLRVALRWFSKGWALESISWKRGLPLDEEMGVDGLWGGLTFGFRAAGIVRILSAILHVGCFFHGTRVRFCLFIVPSRAMPLIGRSSRLLEDRGIGCGIAVSLLVSKSG